MPRGRKKASTSAKETKVAEVKNSERKSYPTVDERIEMANEKIERLTTLNEKRQTLINKTEEKLNERKSAYDKSQTEIEKEKAKLDRLVNSKNKPATKAEKRELKAAQKEKMANLFDALKESGKTVDDLLAFLGK